MNFRVLKLDHEWWRRKLLRLPHKAIIFERLRKITTHGVDIIIFTGNKTLKLVELNKDKERQHFFQLEKSLFYQLKHH